MKEGPAGASLSPFPSFPLNPLILCLFYSTVSSGASSPSPSPSPYRHCRLLGHLQLDLPACLLCLAILLLLYAAAAVVVVATTCVSSGPVGHTHTQSESQRYGMAAANVATSKAWPHCVCVCGRCCLRVELASAFSERRKKKKESFSFLLSLHSLPSDSMQRERERELG